jgi:FkbM family methyltransferase
VGFIGTLSRLREALIDASDHVYAGGALALVKWADGRRRGAALEGYSRGQRAVPRMRLRYGSPDVTVFRQVFDREEYRLDLLKSPRLIVDAGAHIGLASVYFALRYPDATIVAIEPERENHSLLCANTSGLSNVEPVHAALLPTTGSAEILNPDDPNWSYRVRRADHPTPMPEQPVIPAMSPADILASHGEERINLLKLDVEGSELELMRESSSWIDSVDVILVEIHEEAAPGAARAVYKSIDGFSDVRTFGSLVMAARTGWVGESSS